MKRFATLLCIGILLIPTQLHAQTKEALVERIVELQQQVLTLQARLQQANTFSAVQVFPLRRSWQRDQFYEVDGTRIVNGRIVPHARHLELWNLFISIAGKELVSEYVDYFDVYYSPKHIWSAYTETEDGTSWTIGINVADVDFSNSDRMRDTAHTFVHELGHLITSEYPDLLSEFESRFWSSSDYRHARSIDSLTTEAEVKKAFSYYQNNHSRFVTEYATTRPPEDLAESFLYFVISSKPKGRTLEDRKVRFFYEYDGLVKLRNHIRRALY